VQVASDLKSDATAEKMQQLQAYCSQGTLPEMSLICCASWGRSESSGLLKFNDLAGRFTNGEFAWDEF